MTPRLKVQFCLPISERFVQSALFSATTSVVPDLIVILVASGGVWLVVFQVKNPRHSGRQLVATNPWVENHREGVETHHDPLHLGQLGGGVGLVQGDQQHQHDQDSGRAQHPLTCCDFN